MVCVDESARGEKTPREVRPIITSAEIIQAIKTTEVQGGKVVTQIWGLDGELISMKDKKYDVNSNLKILKRGEQDGQENSDKKSERGG